jgi:hypothetical protein
VIGIALFEYAVRYEAAIHLIFNQSKCVTLDVRIVALVGLNLTGGLHNVNTTSPSEASLTFDRYELLLNNLNVSREGTIVALWTGTVIKAALMHDGSCLACCYGVNGTADFLA